MRPINDIIKDIYARLDKYSLVVQKDLDVGDSAYRSAIFSCLLKLIDHPQSNEYYHIMLQELTVSPGVFHRSANSSSWAYDPLNFSRDQAAALMLAASLHNDNQTTKQFYYECRHREMLLNQIPKWGKYLSIINPVIGFHQNVNPGANCLPSDRKVPDLVGNGEWANQIRNRGQWWLYPFLILLDISFVLGLYLRKKQLWDFDSLYAKDLIYANLKYPTIFSVIARIFYTKTDYINRIRNNYADANNGIEPLGELYELVCRRYINKENI